MIRHASLVSPLGDLAEVEQVIAPAFDGEVGILTPHAPMMTLLGKGLLLLGTNGAQGRFAVEGGFLQVVDDNVRVVTEKAEAV